MRTPPGETIIIFPAGAEPLPWTLVAGRGTTATTALAKANIPFTMHEYKHDPNAGSFGLEASQALACSAGRRGLEIGLSPADLVKATGATVAAITAR
jgi:prolyl-tRNA editing enzyme YbaK/EbsC (Cys-tRNA(Pro) deacylase)